MKANTKSTKKVIEEKTELELWKDEFRKVYKSYIGGKEYTWRRITRSEYHEVMGYKEGDTVEERIYNRQAKIVSMVILGMKKEELDFELSDLSGLATSLSEEVMEMSGFNVRGTEEL